MAPPDVGHAITAYNTKSVADTLRERLPREENQGQGSSRLATTTTTSVRKPLRRSDVRLRERERALAALREKFYDSTTIDDSVLDFPHGDKGPASVGYDIVPGPEASPSSASLHGAAGAVVGQAAPGPSYPAYFNTASVVQRKKGKGASSAVEPRYNKSNAKSASQRIPEREAQEAQLAAIEASICPSPAQPMVAPALVAQISRVTEAEAMGMREQISRLIGSAGGRIEDIFSTGTDLSSEIDQVAEGSELVKQLNEMVQEIPNAMVANESDTIIDKGTPLSDRTAGITAKLTSGADAIRSHHNLFSQFQFKCVPVKQVLAKVVDRAEKVAGLELLEQYRKDTAMTGFSSSKPAVNPRVMGTYGKTRRLGSTVRHQFA